MNLECINNLEELNNSFGKRIKVKNILEGRDADYICETKDLINNENIYSFLSFDSKYPQDRPIKIWKVGEDKISFKQNGTIEITSYNNQTYNPLEKLHEEKLRLIQAGGLN